MMKGCCRPKSTVDVRLSLANLSQLLLLSHKRTHEGEESELQMKGEGEGMGIRSTRMLRHLDNTVGTLVTASSSAQGDGVSLRTLKSRSYYKQYSVGRKWFRTARVRQGGVGRKLACGLTDDPVPPGSCWTSAERTTEMTSEMD